MAADISSASSGLGRRDATALSAHPRRLSMEEDYYYREIMSGPRRPSQPPTYDVAIRSAPPAFIEKPRLHESARVTAPNATGKGKGKADTVPEAPIATAEIQEQEELPAYWCDVHAEGLFNRKMEIEETTKKAEDRHWNQCYVELHGTALKVYHFKKDWAWKRTQDGPGISPDNPPWIKKTSLERTYSLLHADAGIAADYVKRRYVIRIRAETDQFLLSCIEMSTFVRWLECLFAAIDVASPLEEREFPRDHSIPRIQRLRWFRGQQASPSNDNRLAELTASISNESNVRQESGPSRPVTSHSYGVPDPEDTPPAVPPLPLPIRAEPELSGEITAQGSTAQQGIAPMDPMGRLSTTSYPNSAVDEETGKWAPAHRWTNTHDQLYAKLCYAVLLFRSPRKSNFIIMKGKQWFVEWNTGRMFRVLPPAYNDISEMFGPWQAVHNENRRI